MGRTVRSTPRDKPPYHADTFKSPKAKEILEYILSRRGWVIEVEGGKRGSKDVLAIKGWSDFLMVTPDKEHLVLGRTLEHAIITVLKSQGFGLYYCIPSGEFTRESISGGSTRGVFKFKDAYGIEKIVYFYGNEKRDDFAKFKGFSLGSVYVNEGNEQHINGLREAKDRTNAALRPRVLVTQNPKGGSHVFYSDFEKPLIYSDEEILIVRSLKTRLADVFETDKQSILEDMEKAKRKLVRDFLKQRKVPKADMLPKKELSLLMSRVSELKERYNKKIGDLKVKDYIDDYDDPDNDFYVKMHSASVEQIINFTERHENPNDVNNGLDFAYFHFTHEDNPSMSDTDRKRVERTYDTKSPSYQRDILGLRATVDHPIWPTFNEDNLYEHEINRKEMTRVLGVDLGYDHPFAVVDGYLDKNNTLWCDNELLIHPHLIKEKANNVHYIERLKELIASANDGDYDRLRVDPSAKGFINQAISSGLLATRAKNRVRNYQPEERSESDKIEDRKIVGINLVREGFRLKKIMVHRKRCPNLIKQIQGYAYDMNKLEVGVEAPIKINDDLCDGLRYIINSEIGYVALWEEGGEVEEDVEKGQERILGEEISQKERATELQKEYTKTLIDAFKGTTDAGQLF